MLEIALAASENFDFPPQTLARPPRMLQLGLKGGDPLLQGADQGCALIPDVLLGPAVAFPLFQ